MVVPGPHHRRRSRRGAPLRGDSLAISSLYYPIQPVSGGGGFLVAVGCAAAMSWRKRSWEGIGGSPWPAAAMAHICAVEEDEGLGSETPPRASRPVRFGL